MNNGSTILLVECTFILIHSMADRRRRGQYMKIPNGLRFNTCQLQSISSGPMVQHYYFHGVTTFTHPSPVITSSSFKVNCNKTVFDIYPL